MPPTAVPPHTMRALADGAESMSFDDTAVGADLEPAAAPVADVSDGGAVYAVEFPICCPHCQSSIQTMRALRVLRTQVPFMSTLPRKGYVLVCPECSGLLSAELSGLL